MLRARNEHGVRDAGIDPRRLRAEGARPAQRPERPLAGAACRRRGPVAANRRLAATVATILVAATVSLLTSSHAAAGAEKSQEAASESVVLRIGSTSRPDSLNPFVASNQNALGVLALVYDQLVFQDENLQAEPALARAWSGSKDRRTWVFRIRNGQKWSDGEPVTARDVAFSLTRAKSVRGSPYARMLENVKTIERTGRTRVVVTLKKPSRDAPPLAVPILPRHIWSSVTRQETPSFENEPPVGSGRFRLLESADSDLIRLARNEEHWSGPGPIDTVELRLFESESAVAGALERGEIDLADDLSPATLARLDGIANIGTHAAETASFISLGVNAGAPRGNGSPILRDARVRRAIAHALDRDALRRQALGEYGVTGTTIVPPVSPFHAEPATDALLDHDVEKARRLLDRAGVRDDDGNGVRELRGGAPARLRLYTRSALPETEVLGTAIATALDAIGIPVQPETLTDRELERRIKGGRYDLFIWGWASEPDPDFILSVLSCGEVGGPGLSDTYFCDPAYERLYQQQRTTRSAARRGRLVQELQLRAYREAPYVVLYYRPRLQAYRADRFVPSDDAGAGVLALAADPASSIALEPVPGAPPPEEVPDTGLEAGASDVAETSDSLRDELSEPRAWIVIGVAALLVLLALTLLLRRLRRARVVGATFDESDLETFEIDELEHDPDDLAGH